MPELGPYGSVRGARGNSRPYRDSDRLIVRTARMTRCGDRRASCLSADLTPSAAFETQWIGGFADYHPPLPRQTGDVDSGTNWFGARSGAVFVARQGGDRGARRRALDAN